MRKIQKVPQSSDPIENVEDEAVHKELGDNLVRAATTASSLEAEQDSDSLQRDELMTLCTTLQNKVIDLEKIMITQRNEITSLKKRVKKLKKKNRSRTHRLKKLYKVRLTTRVESSDNEESLGEDASKQVRINAIDADEEITLVSVHDEVISNDADKEMFDVNVLDGEEVFVAGQNENIIEEVVDLTQDKGKGIMMKEHVKPKKKDQTRLDEEAAKKEQKENELFDAEKATLSQQILEKRRKRFAAKRVEEKRNKPPTQAPQRKIMFTYLKNMEGYTLKQLKMFDFDRIQEMFDRAFRRVRIVRIKRLLDIVGIIAAQVYVNIALMKEDLKDLYKLVKARHGSIRPVESMDYLLWNDMKIMFEPLVEDESMQIYVLVEKKYPLTPPTLLMKMEKKLIIDSESKMAYQLLKLIKKQIMNDQIWITILQGKICVVFNFKVDIKDHSFSPNSKIKLFLFNSNNCINGVKKRSPHDERNFSIFLHFENNKIDRKGLRVSRDSFSYKEYGISLKLSPRSKRARGKNQLMKAVRSSSYILIVPSLSSSNHVFASPGGDEVVWLALELKDGDRGACGLHGDVGVKLVVRSWC
nr:hypothetical protein [Tanacetum cinerariifolium]